MTLNHDITIIRNCTTSEQLFAVAEAHSQQVSDLENRLREVELAYNWDRIEVLIERLAVARYIYNYAYDAASELEEDEHECMMSNVVNDAMMGDRA
jgi:hypothetical protein